MNRTPGAYQMWTNECGTPISEPQECVDLLSYKKEQLIVSKLIYSRLLRNTYLIIQGLYN